MNIDIKHKDYIFGFTQEFVLLILNMILYNWVFIDFVREGKYMFLGSDYLFFIELLLFPFLNLVLARFKYLIGNISGAIVYLFVLIPLGILIGGGH